MLIREWYRINGQCWNILILSCLVPLRIKILHFSSVQWLSRVWLFATPWTAARQASLSVTNSRSLLKLGSTESMMPSNYLILCRPLLLPPSIFPSIRVFMGQILITCLIFWGTTKPSHGSCTFYVPSGSAQGAQFSHILSNTCLFKRADS